MFRFVAFFKMLILFVSIGVSQNSYCQNEKIVFKYGYAGALINPEYQKIVITIEKIDSYYEVIVHLDKNGLEELAIKEILRNSLKTDQTGKDSIRLMEKMPRSKVLDYSLEISENEYWRIVNAIKKIKPTEIVNSLGKNYIHGYSCEIQYGDAFGHIKYKIHSPKFNGEKRGNPNFSNACKLILEIANIKPRKVLK
ncbi:hypothetical protein M0D21_09825 [Aquimarina sp. D1M17]|uniref:hypothetical protein n=1 Tax=Aquimarina acroporae TaxID=2937283 RepID=UPI0020BFE469|nr:hypothetical protein [Aquimarina acroporae]MCK8521865.1 hypothetical protein [Aquimarina acroporae]